VTVDRSTFNNDRETLKPTDRSLKKPPIDPTQALVFLLSLIRGSLDWPTVHQFPFLKMVSILGRTSYHQSTPLYLENSDDLTYRRGSVVHDFTSISEFQKASERCVGQVIMRNETQLLLNVNQTAHFYELSRIHWDV
jgi:hypothetical protein